MFCKNCGAPIDDTAYVCPHCGTPVDTNANNSIPGNNSGYPNNNGGYPNNNYNNYGYPNNNYNGYQQNQPNYPYQNGYTDKSNTIAIVGFIFSFLIAIVGLICSIIGYNRAVREGRSYKGLALAGIIISAVNMVLGIIINSYYYY